MQNTKLFLFFNKLNKIFLHLYKRDFTFEYFLIRLKDKITVKRNIINYNNDSQLLYSLINSGKPCMITRLGSVELEAIIMSLAMRKNKVIRYIDFLFDKTNVLNYKDEIISALRNNAGVFNIDEKTLNQFADLYISSMKDIDILGSWRIEEKYIQKYFSKNIEKVSLATLDPLSNYNKPWSSCLKNKKVLVIHPFSDSIKKQYEKRRYIFDNPEILPDFDLITFKSVQSIAGEEVPYNTWFDALDDMKNKIKDIDFDIALIGCGAYGLPLAHFIKQLGKQAVHLGGVTQILFGIRGKRWDERPDYQCYFNDYWIYPSNEERPKNSQTIENGCYW